MAVSDHQMNGFKYESGADKSDCYIVDLENFSNGVDNEHSIHSTTTPNSRITVIFFSFLFFSFYFFFPFVVIKTQEYDKLHISYHKL